MFRKILNCLPCFEFIPSQCCASTATQHLESPNQSSDNRQQIHSPYQNYPQNVLPHHSKSIQTATSVRLASEVQTTATFGVEKLSSGSSINEAQKNNIENWRKTNKPIDYFERVEDFNKEENEICYAAQLSSKEYYGLRETWKAGYDINDEYRFWYTAREQPYGVTFAAFCRQDCQKVFIRQVNPHYQAFNQVLTAIKQIFILKKLKKLHSRSLLEMNAFRISHSFKEYYIVFDYVPKSLAELLKENCLEKAVRKRLIYELVQGVAEIHSIGYAHLALEPKNIRIDQFGSIKIEITHNCTHFTELTYTSDVSLAYRPPEYRVSSSLTSSVDFDMWSIGVLIVQLYTGKRLFETQNEQLLSDLIQKALQLLHACPFQRTAMKFEADHGGFPLNETINALIEHCKPAELEVIRSLLTADPLARKDCAQIVHELQYFSELVGSCSVNQGISVGSNNDSYYYQSESL